MLPPVLMTTSPVAKRNTGVLKLFRVNVSILPAAMVIVVKLKMPLVGRFSVMLLVTLSGPSAPVLPEENCASAPSGLMRNNPITN